VTGGQRGEPGMRVIASVADPLAELARLRRPPGPWLHLLDGAPSDARQLGWMLAQDGVVVRHLRGHNARTSYGLFDEVGAALQLPGDPVEDWPALVGLLTDMSWLPGSGHLLVVTRGSLLLAAEQPSNVDGFVLAVREVARGRAEEGEPVPFHVVLQDDAVGLAALRPRLEAAGARYDELTGWDAEEPFAEPAGSTRVGYARPEPGLDAADEAVVSVLSTWDGVVAVRRAWETFRGPDTARVRMYLPLLATEPPDPVLRGLAGAVSIAARNAGTVALALPTPADEAGRNPRQQEALAASVELWPSPEPVPVPVVAVAPPAVVSPAPDPAVTEPTESDVDSPGAAPVLAADSPGPDAEPAPSDVDTQAPAADETTQEEPAGEPYDDPAAEFELVAANLEWDFATGAEEPDQVDAVLVRHAEKGGRLVGLFRTWVKEPGSGWARVVMEYVGSGSIADVETERSTAVELLRRAGGKRCCVEVIGAADVSDVHEWLRERSVTLWTAHPRVPEPRPAPETEPAPAAVDVDTVAPWPTDVPAGSGPESGRAAPPGAESTEAAPVSAPDSVWPADVSGSGPAGVASVSAPESVWPADVSGAEFTEAAAVSTPESVWPADVSGPEPAGVASVSVPESVWPAAVPPGAAPGPTAVPDSPQEPGRPAGRPPGAAPAPSTSDSPLPDAATFEPGPDDTEAIARLLDWAPDQPGLIGLVSAWTDLAGARTLVIGVVMEPDADHDALHAAADAIVANTARTQRIVPAKGLPPMLLRLYRSATRLWTRKVKREAAAPRPGEYKSGEVGGVSGDIANVFSETVVREDVHLDNGFTIVAIDAETAVRTGNPEPDWTDAAVIARIQDQPNMLAAVRGSTRRDDGDMAVYGILVDEHADRDAVRTAVATVIADGGATRAAVEVFCPFERIDVLHLNIYENGLQLWRRQRQEAPPAEAGGTAADDAG
jgi:hypothetical protein